VNENRSRDECFLKRVESIIIKRAKLPEDIFLDKMNQWNNDVQVDKNKLVVKVGKT